jgi:hypothetical protein
MKVEKFLEGAIFYEEDTQTIWLVQKSDKTEIPIANVRGWSFFSNELMDFGDAVKTQDALGNFIANAIKEKLLRDKKTITHEQHD